MRRTAKLAGVTLLMLAVSPTLSAQAEFDPAKLYAGVGIGYNDLGSGWDDALGAQVFAGYELNRWDDLALGLEIGYMESGSFDRKNASGSVSHSGLWSTALGTVTLSERFYLLGRLGLDFGDDDGLMAGVGAGGRINNNLDLRGELVERDDISSLQANLVVRF